MENKTLVTLVLLAGLVVGYFFGYDHGFEKAVERSKSVHSFETCAEAGYPIMESYPEQCRTPDGRTFVRDISGDSDSPEGVACTMEAKLCPDGSHVGRSGPNCEFTACP